MLGGLYIQILITKIPCEIDERLLQDLLSVISPYKKKSIQNYLDVKDLYRSLIGELLIRYHLIRKYNLHNSQISIDLNEYGKPFITDYPDIHFNVSHSSDYVVCIIDNQEIGIDIEEIRPTDIHLYQRIFSEKEFSYIIHHDTPIKAFYTMWTLKESFLKMLGTGLRASLLSFSLVSQNQSQFITLQTYFKKNPYLKFYDYESDYVISVCSKNSNFPKKLTKIEFQTLVNCLSNANEYDCI